MFAVMGYTVNGVEPESHLETIQAANNRLRMLKKYHPNTPFWVETLDTETTQECDETLILPRYQLSLDD
jgi:hypothetical protein